MPLAGGASGRTNDPSVVATCRSTPVRHATPVIHFRRTATADTELHGQRIRAGDKVVVWYSSGNRDETVFDEPDRFDISRPNNRHLGFGSGPHICVGSRLAELQLKLLFTQLAARVSRFDPDGRHMLSIPLPAQQVTSVTFAGPDLDRLLSTNCLAEVQAVVWPLIVAPALS